MLLISNTIFIFTIHAHQRLHSPSSRKHLLYLEIRPFFNNYLPMPCHDMIKPLSLQPPHTANACHAMPCHCIRIMHLRAGEGRVTQPFCCVSVSYLTAAYRISLAQPASQCLSGTCLYSSTSTSIVSTPLFSPLLRLTHVFYETCEYDTVHGGTLTFLLDSRTGNLRSIA